MDWTIFGIVTGVVVGLIVTIILAIFKFGWKRILVRLGLKKHIPSLETMQQQTADTVERVEQKIDELEQNLREGFGQDIATALDGVVRRAGEERLKNLEQAAVLTKNNNYRDAIPYFEASFEPNMSPSERMALYLLIGNCYHSLSDFEEAEGEYRKAETAAKEENDKEGLAAALGNIGNIYQTKGELDKALDYLQQALKIFKEIGKKEGEASARGNIGVIYRIKGELDKALDYHQQSLKINREIGIKEGQASALGNIGNIYQTKGELDKALELYEQVFKIEKEIGRRWGEANALGNNRSYI
ncbi:MAG TPA: tetratricopeptide repeat protein [Dehalococcoidia bacterium]|nr:tetratricopeptide repeat protein [Dehalococcoidia bacterium]